MIKSYLSIIKISLKSIFANRSSIVILLLQALIPSLVMFYLWSVILKDGQTVGGFNKSQLIIYYLGVNLINSFVWYAIDWELNDDIHSGELSNIIHRPISIQSYYFFRMIGDRLANLLMLLPFLLIGLAFIIRKNLLIVSFLKAIELIVSIILAMVLWFLFSYIIGCAAYWFNNLFFVLLVKEVVVNLLSGYYFPLEILPNRLLQVFKVLPFQYFSSFPIDTLVKNLSLSIWAKNTLIEFIWIVALSMLLEIVNKKGLQKYSDVMG